MRYTELTKKELQREYTKLTRRYTDFVREPLELDMAAEDTFGKSESRRAHGISARCWAKNSAIPALHSLPGRRCGCRPGYHAGLRPRTVELCRQAGVRFDAIDHSTVLARIILRTRGQKS